MSAGVMITVTTVLLCLILGIFSLAPAAVGASAARACCMKHYRKPVPFARIKGYREQTITQYCRMDAIIFYTVRKREICATQKDEWVRKILELLSLKLKTMSKDGSTASEAQKKKRLSLSFTPGSGFFLSTTESYLNITEAFH